VYIQESIGQGDGMVWNKAGRAWLCDQTASLKEKDGNMEMVLNTVY
jgi:hypothetical protein